MLFFDRIVENHFLVAPLVAASLAAIDLARFFLMPARREPAPVVGFTLLTALVPGVVTLLTVPLV